MKISQFQTDHDHQTHLYMIPRNSYGTLTTNKKSKVKMGYSIQSIFMNTTGTFQQVETKEPIIDLVEGGIRTNDKYGKATVIMEEDHSYGDQVAMLNILITDIYSMAAQNFYEALSLPVGSSIEIPIKF